MRKIFYTVFSISQICFLLLYPQEALAASKEGMQLWLNVLLPVLLPFLILTGILIHTNMAGKLLQPVEVIWNKDRYWVSQQQVLMQSLSEHSAAIRLVPK